METVDIVYLGTTPDDQSYSPADTSLITTSAITPTFGEVNDYIECHVLDLNGNIVAQNYNVTDYGTGQVASITDNTYTSLQLNPEANVRSLGIDRGSVLIKYNLYKSLFESGPGRTFWIKEISKSRTEIKVARQDLSNTALLSAFTAFDNLANNVNYYPDFLLNFGQDNTVIAVNAVYVEQNNDATIVFKLYEPLPTDYNIKSTFWVVQKVAESIEFQVTINVESAQVVEVNTLRGPNYKVSINQRVGQTTPYYNYTSLFSTNLTSSYQQLQSWFDDKAIQINVDYSDFNNYIHFSSATERLLNFKYKMGLIEAYEADIKSGTAISNVPPNIISASNALLQQQIDSIITKFDTYEYYLYFTSASTSWPKQNNIQPYAQYSVTSSQVINWLGQIDVIPTTGQTGMLYSASLYDSLNKDNLEYTMPAYIKEDSNNAPFMTFLHMIGQHFDNIWLYYKDLSNRYSAENNPLDGISLDVVADALRGFGIQLYTNSNISDNIYYSMLGLNDVGSTLPLTSSQYAQTSISTNTITPLVGQEWLSQSIYLPPFSNENLTEYVTVFTTPSTGVTASFGPIPPMQLEKEYYKRLYHNLPYLLKTRGTQRGVKALIACYGIPSSILTVNEFGGGDIYAAPNIQQLQNTKVFTGSILSISSSLLSPFVTNQYYQNNTERGSADIEVGFSPADSINAHITGTLGNFNIMQYIGNPTLQYSSSYTPLDLLSRNYFDTHYYSRYNVWDFIRLIKFYNNSLFKSIKDYVPARASVTSGIIIKPHILERNKYARHEPAVIRPEHSESIDTAFISGSDAPGITRSTAYSSSVITLSGLVAVNNNRHWEPYTGEFSGSVIDPTNGHFPQIEQSSITAPWTSSIQGANVMYTTYSINYLLNNVSSSVKSNRFLDLDYSSNQDVPVNFGLITQSIDNFPASLNDPYAPFAQLQDYNYYLRRSILPRYSGSKSTSLYYNIYSPPSTTWTGDSSYGNNPAIDRYDWKYAYLVNIYTASIALPRRSNAQIKYLIDNEGNTLDLTKANNNLVDVQNIFKSSLPGEIALFDYNPSNPDVQYLANNKTMQIYEGGWLYSPILYKLNNNDPVSYTLSTPYYTSSLVSSPGGVTYGPILPINTVGFSGGTPLYGQYYINGQYTFGYQIEIDIVSNPGGLSTQDLSIQVVRQPLSNAAPGTQPQIYTLTISAYTNVFPVTFYMAGNSTDLGVPYIDRQQSFTVGTGTTVTSSQYITGGLDNNPDWQALDSRTILLSATQSITYGTFIQNATSTQIETPVLSFTLDVNDMIKLYNNIAGGWAEEEEYRVLAVNDYVSSSGTFYKAITTDRDINPASTNSYSTPSQPAFPTLIRRYIVNKHIPDETNLILRYSPRNPINEKGLVYSYNLDPAIKANSGNIVQELKGSNFI